MGAHRIDVCVNHPIPKMVGILTCVASECALENVALASGASVHKERYVVPWETKKRAGRRVSITVRDYRLQTETRSGGLADFQ